MRDLKATAVGFLSEDLEKHHTDRFHASESQIYFRRGQLFHLIIRFNGIYDPRIHLVRLDFFMPGDDQEETLATVRVRSAEDRSRAWPPAPGAWGARQLGNARGVVLDAAVISPASMPVGLWNLRVRTELVQAPRIHNSVYNYTGKIYFLFNPWNKGDTTYFDNTELLEEYVLGDYTKIYEDYDHGKDWTFGQFEECVIPAFEMALIKDNRNEWLPHINRGDPVRVARAISRVVNAARADECGILMGAWQEERWKNDEHVKAPFYWMGSAEILQQYVDTGVPVRYGQCWVFSGVAATVCRALGLPARCVSNISSGHDNNKSLTIDMYYDENFEIHKVLETEMIWNFHCWTDVWMQRQDLNNPDYDGWQAIDATPQEESDNYFQCGPAPVKAILQGDTNLDYDVPFIYTEVNGDRVRWLVKSDKSNKLIDIDENCVGEAILTKEPLSPYCKVSNITNDYKYPEGTHTEKRGRIVAAHNLKDKNIQALKVREQMELEQQLNDVQFKTELPRGVNIGADIEVALLMRNSSNKDRTIIFSLVLERVDGNGRNKDVVKESEKVKVVLGPQLESKTLMNVSVEEYIKHVQENKYFRFTPKCRVLETDQFWLANENFIHVYTPWVYINIDEKLTTDQLVEATFSLDGTVKFPLTRCTLNIQGPALEKNVSYKLDDVPANSNVLFTIKLPKLRAGRNMITAKFTSKELPKAQGRIEVEVAEVLTSPRSATSALFEGHLREIGGSINPIVIGGDIYNYLRNIGNPIRRISYKPTMSNCDGSTLI